MSQSGLDRVAVLGAGVLGGQIAWHSAYRGKTVAVYDPFSEALEKAKKAHETYAGIYRTDLDASEEEIAATRERLAYFGEMEPAVNDADLVIEAVPEVPKIKLEVYEELGPLLPDHTLIATNSSTLLPREFADATGRPDRFCALHFANLIWALNLVEVMAHPGTSKETLTAVTRFGIEIGMVPIPVAKEKNGYVLNSWLEPLLTASLGLVVDGVTTPEDLDRTYMIMNRGCRMGPFGIVDIIGVKTTYDVSAYWGEVNDDDRMRRNAAYLKEHFLDRGLQGMMGGKGFYEYPDPAYAAPDFLEVPDLSAVPGLVERAMLD
jgi:3-hydroxyacyl-CoA dehydrogenase